MGIVDIRSRQIIDCSDEEMKAEISAILGGAFDLLPDGSFELQPGRTNLNPAGRIFSHAYRGRKFSGLLSVSACVMDIQLELIDLMKEERWPSSK